jgi:hypothetical protein
MNKRFWVTLLVIVFVCSIAFASVGVKEEGTMLGAATDIDFVGVGITASGTGSTKTITLAGTAEEIATYTTLTVAQSGTVFIATGTTEIGTASRTFKLPAITSSNDGVYFTFVNGTHAGASAPELNVNPWEHDTIFLSGSMTDGVSIRGIVSADSYPSITLVAFGGNWYADDVVGGWSNGG